MDFMLFVFRIVCLAAIVLLILWYVNEFENGEDLKFSKKVTFIGVPVAMILFVLSLCVAYVPANTVGIKWSIFGGTQKETLNEGLVFKTPLDKVYTIPTTVQERTMKDVSIQTKDSQFLTVDVNVKFSVNKDNAYNVFKRYETIDNLKKNIMANYTQKAMSLVSTDYNIVDILGEKQDEVYEKSSEKLESMLKNEGVNLVQLTFKDLDAGDDIEKAIRDEAVAKKSVETAKQKKEKAKIEAETKKIEAQGEADANKIKKKELSKSILVEEWIEKWNGETPKVSGSGSTGMYDISSYIAE